MNLNRMIDHTMLKADATKETIIRYCREAKEHEFASVCVNTCFVPLVADELKGSEVKTCCVVGFPLGAMLTTAKAFEASEAVKAGADEVDMVINISALKDKDDNYVEDDIRAVVEASKGAVVKVIIETCLLTDEEKVRACELSVKAGADFVKTSTGFSTRWCNCGRRGIDEKDRWRACKGKGKRRYSHTGGGKGAGRSRRERTVAGNGIVLL